MQKWAKFERVPKRLVVLLSKLTVLALCCYLFFPVICFFFFFKANNDNKKYCLLINPIFNLFLIYYQREIVYGSLYMNLYALLSEPVDFYYSSYNMLCKYCNVNQ